MTNTQTQPTHTVTPATDSVPTLAGQAFTAGISRVAIIGAGVMGPGIAQVFSEAGYPVDLCDIDNAMLERGMASLHDGLALKVELGLITSDQADTARGLVHAHPPSDGILAQAQLIIEAVTEKSTIKQEVFTRIAKHAGPDAVLWSNTSTLDVFALAPAPLLDRMLVAHWFAPPHILPLVEVVAPQDASKLVLNESVALLRQLGKTPVVMEHFLPGFIINRLLRALGREAFHMIESGLVSIEAMDVAVRSSLAPRMQILGLMQRYDFTGLGLSMRNLENPLMVDAPVDLAPSLLKERINQGHLGVTTGNGFYDYGQRDVLTLQRERDRQLWEVVQALGDKVHAPRPI